MTWSPGNHADTSQGASGKRFAVSKLRQVVVQAMSAKKDARFVHRVSGSLDAIVGTPTAWKDRLRFILADGSTLDLNQIESIEIRN